MRESAGGRARRRRAAPVAAEHDVAIVGASIAGCTAATLFARRGLRVALIERRPELDAFKTVCTTYVQACAAPVLERLGVADDLEAAGATRAPADIWTRWGWVRPEPVPQPGRPTHGFCVRRETLEPLVRRVAADTPGVDLLLGHSAQELALDDGRVAGVEVHDRAGTARTIRAQLVVGADGRASRVAKLAGVRAKTTHNGRFAYLAQYEGVPVARAQMWLLDPEVAYLFPQDGVTLLVAMPVHARRDEFRADPEGALLRTISGLPDAPDLGDARRVSNVVGKLDLTNHVRPAAARGIAFVGDAALTSDPVWGDGCGFAAMSSEWLVDATAEALVTGHGLDAALRRYRRHHRRALRGYRFIGDDFARARPMHIVQRTMFAAAARDANAARHMHAFGSRHIDTRTYLSPLAVARAVRINAAHRRAKNPDATDRAAAGALS